MQTTSVFVLLIFYTICIISLDIQNHLKFWNQTLAQKTEANLKYYNGFVTYKNYIIAGKYITLVSLSRYFNQKTEKERMISREKHQK